jgi:myo-inositol-1(or 4)-monophosphatase
MQPTLEFIHTLAANAGEILLSYVGKEMDVQHKSRTDLVTRADHDSENYLIDTIRKAFPDHAINAEESGEWEGAAEHQWYIDPLDGTLNFAHGVPIYCVSIGYAYQGEMALGVVYDPVREEFFCGERGQGAMLNGEPIQVSDETNLIECMLATGFPHEPDAWGTPADNTANFIRLNQVSQSVRRLGSAALDVAYVAAGRLDGFWQVAINQWDVAAGGLIVREAGGLVTDIVGNSDFLAKPVSFLCANKAIHAKMLQVLQAVREQQGQGGLA